MAVISAAGFTPEQKSDDKRHSNNFWNIGRFEPGATPDPKDLARFCGETLAAYKVPTAWEIRTEPLRLLRLDQLFEVADPVG